MSASLIDMEVDFGFTLMFYITETKERMSLSLLLLTDHLLDQLSKNNQIGDGCFVNIFVVEFY